MGTAKLPQRHYYVRTISPGSVGRMRNPGPDEREMPPLTPLKRLGRDIVTWPRRVTATNRSLPNVVLLGAQRAGTTSFYEHLNSHPGVVLSKTKEIHFFDNYTEQGLDWYRSHFPMRRWVKRRSDRLGYDIAIGEGSPYYLFHPAVPERLHRSLPRARLIVLLRDPIERALSHFRHEVKNGSEMISDFQSAWDLEEERLQGAEERLLTGASVFEASHNRFSYTSRGDYAPQLERWLEKFDSSQLHVIRSEDLFERPEEIMGELFNFLGLPTVEMSAFPTLNSTHTRQQKSEDLAVRKRLAEHFRPKVERLESLLGRSMGWMRNWD